MEHLFARCRGDEDEAGHTNSKAPRFDPTSVDPTLNLSTLLISKPMPFEFELRPRSEERAERVRRLFGESSEKGEYKESREFWGDNQGKGKFCGWGKV